MGTSRRNSKQNYEEGKLGDFIEEAKENSKKLEELVGKEKTEKILNIIKIQKQKISL